MPKYIHIEGARTHNLKNISLKIPHEQLVVITGCLGFIGSHVTKKCLDLGLSPPLSDIGNADFDLKGFVAGGTI